MQKGIPSIRKYLSKLFKMIFKAQERKRAIYSTHEVQIHLQKCCETAYFSDVLLKTGTQNHTGQGIHFRIAFLLFIKCSCLVEYIYKVYLPQVFTLLSDLSKHYWPHITGDSLCIQSIFFFSKIILSPKFQALWCHNNYQNFQKQIGVRAQMSQVHLKLH